ncbi:MAG: hypothetical protein U1E73_02325 [Planctomycetota bacterium]
MRHPNSVSFAALALVLAPIRAQDSIVPYLPKDTIFVAAAPNLSAMAAEFDKMPLAKMWHEQEVQTFLADALEFAKAQFDKGLDQARQAHAQGELPVDPDDVLKLTIGGVTTALTHLEITNGDHGPMPKLGFVVHLDFGSSGATWKKLLDMGLGMLEGQIGNHATKTESEIGGIKLVSLMPNEAGAPDMGINVATLPNGVLFATLPGDIKSILEGMQSKTKVLGAADSFKQLSEHVKASDAGLQSFINIDPMVQFGIQALRIGTEMNPELGEIDVDGVERAIDAMGLRHIGSISGSSNYENGRSVTRMVHLAGKPDSTAATKAIDVSFLKWVPKDAVGFSAWTWDPANGYDALVKGINAYDPKIAANLFDRLAKLEEQLGFKIRDDLFGALGDSGMTWSMPVSTIASMPETAFLLKVKNEQSLVKVLKNASQLSNGMVEFEEGEKRGIKVFTIRVNFDPTRGMGTNPFDLITPTFTFKNGYLVMGFTVGDVKRVLQRMDREDDPKGDIRGNKEFAAVASTIPSTVTSLSFTDWKTNFESFYQLATGLLALVPIGEDVPIDMSLLPDAATLTQHLFASVSYSTPIPGGTESVDVSPFGPEVGLGIAAVAIAAAAVIPNVMR